MKWMRESMKVTAMSERHFLTFWVMSQDIDILFLGSTVTASNNNSSSATSSKLARVSIASQVEERAAPWRTIPTIFRFG